MSSLRAAVAAARTRHAVRRLMYTTHRNDAELDREKRPHGSATLIDHAPGWSEDLATASEASVKADRETTTINEMQQKTVHYVQSHHPQGNNDPEDKQTHATYARDEVGGPLGNAIAGVGEFEGVVGKDDLGPDDMQVESNGRVVTRRVVHEKTTVHEGKPGAGQASR